MAATTPRRSTRLPYTHTPKISERKKGLFQSGSEPPRESLTKHRRLPVVDSESDSEDCDLGIISTLDSSSGDENYHNTPKTPEKTLLHETRSQARKLIENQDLKSFIKSPFTLKKYQTRYSCPESRCTGSISTPATPRLQHLPGTPSSTHSCASAHTTSSTSSRARKSLASLIADTESCSSSLKDLNFDTDSGTDSKENTPTKFVRRSTRRHKMTPKFHSFKGILIEQKKNLSTMKGVTPTCVSPTKTAVVCLTKLDMSNMSPTQILKTPQTAEAVDSPPKLSHNRRSVIEIGESPESTCDSEKSHKRLRNNSLTDTGPTSKYPRLENPPKARLSLFNSDRLKEILSTKSFYGKSNPELNANVTVKISNAIEASTVHHRRPFSHSHSNRHKRRPGQINLGVKHKIRKPKHHKNKIMVKYSTGNSQANSSILNKSTVSNSSTKDVSMISQNSSQDLGTDKLDLFDKENQTIEALLSQWEEDEVPETELSYSKPTKEVACFNSSIIEETNQIFQPITAVPVKGVNISQDSEAIIVELGAKVNEPPQNSVLQSVSQDFTQYKQNTTCFPQNVTDVPQSGVAQDVVMMEPGGHESHHGEAPKSGQFLPVEGGYILVEEKGFPVQEVLPDLDEIEREMKMLDEQILKMAECNNINAAAVLASTEMPVATDVNDKSSLASTENDTKDENASKLFPIFSNPNPGTTTPSTKAEKSSKKSLLKNASDQYVIDAGQKRFGATQCTECGAIYQIGDPQDEHDHMVHHNASDVLKFNGWRDECVIEKCDSWRIIRIRSGESHWRRVETLLARVIHPHLGCDGPLQANNSLSLTAYLYIEKKQIVGCLIAETKTKAYKLIPGDPDCCSVEHYPVKCGISRIWTHINYRRRGIAKRLLDCARASFLYGHAMRTNDVAFSAPTLAGKAFATNYCGTENFYVYLE